MNKPSNVDFLIATDSEMKKVNWTTKGELFGSTRVVVVLFLIFVSPCSCSSSINGLRTASSASAF